METVCNEHGNEHQVSGACVMGAWVCGICHKCSICDTPAWVDGYWNGAAEETCDYR